MTGLTKVRDFRFVLDPSEDIDDYMARWDKELTELQATGLTIAGQGPDGDEPVRAYLLDETDPTGPIVQVYRTEAL